MSGKKGRVMSPVVPGVPDGVAAHNPQQRRPRMGRHEDMVRQQLHDLAHEGGGGGTSTVTREIQSRPALARRSAPIRGGNFRFLTAAGMAWKEGSCVCSSCSAHEYALLRQGATAPEITCMSGHMLKEVRMLAVQRCAPAGAQAASRRRCRVPRHAPLSAPAHDDLLEHRASLEHGDCSAVQSSRGYGKAQ